MPSKFDTRSVALVLAIIVAIAGWGMYFFAPQVKEVIVEKQVDIRYGRSLTVACRDDIRTFDYFMITDYWSSLIASQIYERLFTIDDTLRIQPGLVETWEQPNNLTYIFHLRKGVKFHSGEELTSDNIKFIFDNGSNQSFGAAIYRNLKIISKTEIIDKYTVKVTLKEPYAPFLTDLATNVFIGSKQEYEKWGKDYGTKHPSGTGPFKFVEWQKDSHVILARNDEYWAGKAFLERVTFRIIPEADVRLTELQTGGVDVIQELRASDINILKNDNRFKLDSDVTLSQFFMAFNFRTNWTGPSTNLKFRQGVAAVADYDLAVKTFLGDAGIRSYSKLAPTSWAYDPEIKNYYPAYNETNAKQLIEQAYAELGLPKDYTIIMLCRQDPDRERIATYLQSQLMKIGLKVSLTVLPGAALGDKLAEGKWDIAISGAGGNPDPSVMFRLLMTENIGYGNDAFYSNPVMDKLLVEARKTTDMAQRKELYIQVQRLMATELVELPLFHRIGYYAYNAKINGFTVNSLEHLRLRYVAGQSEWNVWISP